ncbi:MAG: hypothetical protein R3E64_03965 [Halioglobus sp.]
MFVHLGKPHVIAAHGTQHHFTPPGDLKIVGKTMMVCAIAQHVDDVG